MSSDTLQKELETRSGKKLHIKINDNRSTMLSVRWEPDYAKVSLHRMFLDAPQNVMQALGCYLRGEEKGLAPSIKAFIEENVKKLDYSHLLDWTKLPSQGNCYNLLAIYDELNQEYFGRNLELNICWYGRVGQRNRNRVTFGLYYDPLRLIKIHRILDSPFFPKYVVAYIIYHEMVHYVCPSYIDKTGMHRIHSKEFKAEELKFRYYQLAQDWIKEHQEYIFSDQTI